MELPKELTTIQLRRAENAKVFIEHFKPAWERAVTDYPEEYGRGLSAADAQRVSANMFAALVTGSYHHEGRAMKAACKALGIEYKRKSIEAFLVK